MGSWKFDVACRPFLDSVAGQIPPSLANLQLTNKNDAYIESPIILQWTIWSSSNSSNQWFGGIRIWGLVKNFRQPIHREAPSRIDHERLFAVASAWTSAFAVVLERKRSGEGRVLQGLQGKLGVVYVYKELLVGWGWKQGHGTTRWHKLLSKVSWLDYLFGFCVD